MESGLTPVRRKLKGLPKLKRYILPRLNQRAKVGMLPVVSEGKAIPRIIHQTFHSKDLPALLDNNVRKMRAMNPGWEYRFYDDSDIVEFISSNYGPRITNYYRRINPRYGAARADFFRYLLMYKCGGVYLDVKSYTESPLDDALTADDSFLLSQWKNNQGEPFQGWGLHADLAAIDRGEFQQWHIIATPGHPFLKAAIENVLGNIDSYNPDRHGVGRQSALTVTGPIAYTLAIAPLLHVHRHRFVDSEADLGLCYSNFGGTDAHAALLGPHYAQLDEPVINVGAWQKAVSLLLRLLRSARIVPGTNR